MAEISITTKLEELKAVSYTHLGYRKKRTPNGQVYGLYGTALTEKLYYEKREDLRGNYKQRIEMCIRDSNNG